MVMSFKQDIADASKAQPEHQLTAKATHNARPKPATKLSFDHHLWMCLCIAMQVNELLVMHRMPGSGEPWYRSYILFLHNSGCKPGLTWLLSSGTNVPEKGH